MQQCSFWRTKISRVNILIFNLMGFCSHISFMLLKTNITGVHDVCLSVFGMCVSAVGSKLTWCLLPAIRSWSPSSPSTLTRPTASASSLTPRGSTSPREAPTLWSACGTWRSWCVSAASPGQSACSTSLLALIMLWWFNLTVNRGFLFFVAGWTGLWGRWALATTAKCWRRPPRITS